MPRPAYSIEKREEIRQEILAAARQLFAEGGFGGVSIRRVADRIDSSPMRIYHYFRNKDALLRNIWVHIFDDIFDRIETRLQGTSSPAKRLQTFCREWVAYWVEHPDEYRVVYLTKDDSGETGQVSIEEANESLRRFALLVEILDDGVVSGDFSRGDTRLRVEALTSAITGIAHSLVMLPNYPWPDAESLVDQLVDPFISGLAGAAVVTVPRCV